MKNETEIRLDFPMLLKKMHGHPLIYFDNAATTFKPQKVIEAITSYYADESATVHRGAYEISEALNERYFQARKKIQKFIGAKSEKEIIFTGGATEAINLVAYSFGEAFIAPGDEILVSEIEHHSNLVPWQMLAKRKKAALKFIPILESGDIDLEGLKSLLSEKTKLVSLAHISNALGSLHPVKEIVQIIREKSTAKVLVDGAQAIAHLPVDVYNLDVDFYAFSAHKMYGPTGFGVLYGKESLLQHMPPFLGGGDMINKVTLDESSYQDLPYRFEAGTPHIAGAIGASAAIDYMQEIGLRDLFEKEAALLKYALGKLKQIKSLKIVGFPKKRGGLISFYIDGVHNLDIAALLNINGVALRSGHLCAQTTMERFNISSLLRISFSFYNTFQEIDLFTEKLINVIQMLSVSSPVN